MTSEDTAYTWQPSPHFELGEEMRQLVGEGLTVAREEARRYFSMSDREKRPFLMEWAKRNQMDPRFGPVKLGPDYIALATELELAVLHAEKRLFCLMASEAEDLGALAHLHGALMQAQTSSKAILAEEQLGEILYEPCQAVCRQLEDHLAQHELGVAAAAKKRHRYDAAADLRGAVSGLYEISLDGLRDYVDSSFGPEALEYDKPHGKTLEIRHAAASRTLPPEARDAWFVVEWMEELQGIVRQAERDIGAEKGFLPYPFRLGRAANKLAGWPENLRDDLMAAEILSEAHLAEPHFAEFFRDVENAVWMLEEFVATHAAPLLPHFHLNLRPSSRHYLRVRPPERQTDAVVVLLPPRQAWP